MSGEVGTEDRRVERYHEGDFKYSVVNKFTQSLSGSESGKLLTILLNRNLVLGNVDNLFFQIF